jgi:hypothetical protein
MDAQRKAAYRWLLYWAMLDIRRLAWMGFRWRERVNPFFWRRAWRQMRYAGEVADWLHNLAAYSIVDFDGFDEEWFWRGYRRLLDAYPESGVEHYRGEFDRRSTSASAGA